MKLTLRPEWRLWPLASFLGVLDLKTGVTIALLFALLNKVAGVYGLIAVLTGAGGSFAQLSLYLYSVLALVVLVWSLKAVKEEDAKHTLYFAHLFFADHILSTAWTVFFGITWWIYTPHDGRRQANSPAQEEMMKTGSGSTQNMTQEERAEAAMIIWNHEKGMAAVIIILSWLTKIYFSFLLYSYATHLRKGSYRTLPFSRVNTPPYPLGTSSMYHSAIPDEEEETEDFYHVPFRPPHTEGSSISSFADFISAPGRGRKGVHGKSSLNKVTSLLSGQGRGSKAEEIEEEVLFDEAESSSAAASRRASEAE